MKSYNHLYEKVYDRKNLAKALENSAKGKKNKKKSKEVNWCLEHSDKVVEELHDLLVNETYQFRRHKPQIINDGISRKERCIIKPDYKEEQILHHAVIQVLSPIIMKSMDAHCCGSVPGRGGTHGKKYLNKFIRKHPKHCKYCLKLDIKHFFQSVSHEKLKLLIRRKIHDERMCRLLFAIINNYEDTPGKGIPIGYYTSQWFANWYLEGLDHYIKEVLQAKCMVRYMDDIVIFGSNKRTLHKQKLLIEEYLKEKLDLELNHKWQVFRFDYCYIDRNGDIRTGGRFLDFLGYRFYRNRTTMRRSIMFKATRKAKRIKKPTWYTASQMMSYLGRMKETDTDNVFQNYIKDNVNVKQLRKTISKHQRRLNDEHKLEEVRKLGETQGD